MLITELQLKSFNLQGQYEFFVGLLGCRFEERTDDRLALGIGLTRLVLEREHQRISHYHYALGVPGHRFAEATHWLENHVPLLVDQNGRKEFFFKEWNAHAIYFRDADGNIGELIARHNLETSSEGPFGAGSLLGVSEIGVVVNDVAATVAVLEQRYTLRPYQERSHPEFTAVGDEQGMFIVVQTNRPWLPTGERARRSRSSTTFQINSRVYAATME